jgi:hypothetical protein
LEKYSLKEIKEGATALNKKKLEDENFQKVNKKI